MLRTVILLQLTLWVASIHAFFPFFPEWQCQENNVCGDDSKSQKPKSRDVHTFKLSQRVRDNPPASAAKEASRLLRKYKPSRTTPEQPDLTRRENKYSVVSPAPPSTPNSAGIYQDGTDFSYFIQVGFGSSAKPMYMLLDTGAGTTWVMGSDCKADACMTHNSFGPSDSKTFSDTKETFSISYGSGKVAGELAKDTLAVAGMSLSMSFGVANDASGDFTHFPFDGILGVSMSRGATDNFLNVIKSSSALKSNIFSVSLSRNSDGPNTGEVTFGGIDASKYTGDISYTPVSASAGGDWAISLDDMAYDGNKAGIKGRLAYIDTGTSYMFGPPEDVALLHKLIPGAKSSDGFLYTVPCNSDKALTVIFSGVAYTLSPKDWMSPPAGDTCTSNFYGQAVVQGAWLLGDSFLKNVYTVFDVDQTPGTAFSGDNDEQTAGCVPRMAKARSNGATPAHHSEDSTTGNEEDIGLLAAGPDGSDDEDAIIVHPGEPPSEGDYFTNTSSTGGAPATPLQPHLDQQPPRTPRTPRTPNRVRFDLVPMIVGDDANGRPADHYHHHHARDSFDVDDEDPLADSPRQQHRVPLLTGIEAPSVTLASSDDYSADLSRAQDLLHRPRSGLSSAFMNMANSIIGAGIIGQPYAFRQAGLVSGVVLLVGLTVVVDWTIRLIVVNSKLSGSSSFQGTVEKCFGKTGLVAISLAQWVFAFGGMVAFGVIVGDTIPHVLSAIWPGLRDVPVLGALAGRKGVIVIFLLGVSYPLTLYRDIAKLAKASTLALISMGVIVVTVVVQGVLTPSELRGSFGKNELVINDGIFQAIGVISFAFVCHHNSLLIYGSLEKPTIDRFTRVTHYSTGISMVACLLLALSGFLTFGDKTLGNVLNNFPADNTMVNVARLCFGLNMLTTLPLEAFVCREVMLNYYFPGEPFNMNLHLIFSTSLIVSAMTLSLFTCDLGSVFELVGSTSACAMAYILPPLCYIKLTTRSWKTYVAMGIVAFGCAVMGITLFQAVGKIIRVVSILGEGGTQQCM
ncbi:acid protease [Coniochaeta ligniaria NRRL 30616]|uniref:Acid protease n=1 Tax=Coniochaeta ligniaria NRRL 30616 TaxID=1408157 RepID=A0A1J7J2L1_9PEZI|nr:acid protease [Coniochaeta ligniaria NRRL 30616]